MVVEMMKRKAFMALQKNGVQKLVVASELLHQTQKSE